MAYERSTIYSCNFPKKFGHIFVNVLRVKPPPLPLVLICSHLGDPPPPISADVIYEWPLTLN